VNHSAIKTAALGESIVDVQRVDVAGQGGKGFDRGTIDRRAERRLLALCDVIERQRTRLTLRHVRTLEGQRRQSQNDAVASRHKTLK
jgi:hypothetical protein